MWDDGGKIGIKNKLILTEIFPSVHETWYLKVFDFNDWKYIYEKQAWALIKGTLSSINLGGRQYCLMPQIIFQINIDAAVDERQAQIKTGFILALEF